ncbi:MAG: hypothetical protein GVY16_07220 [Planctomycetes bacterium]|nr:hypothetical protein [Planctomycetota bacterium]
MTALTNQQWLLLALAVAAWFVPAVRIARMAPQYGRNSRRWFFISLFASVIPATIVFWRDYMKQVRAEDKLPSFQQRRQRPPAGEMPEPESTTADEDTASARRCEHCGQPVPPQNDDGQAVCPNCRMTRREDRLA